VIGLGRSRRYSPLNRAYGLRRLPDQLLGLAFLASVILHVALVISLVRLTNALPERPVGDVVLMDLTARIPDDLPALVPAAISSGGRPAGTHSAVAEAKSSAPAGPKRGPAAPTAPRTHAPASVSRSEPVAVPAALPAEPPLEARGPAQDGPTLVSAVSAFANGPDVTAPLAFDIDTPLDAGSPEPLPMTVASPPSARPANTLTSVPRIPDWPQRLPETAPPTVLAQEPPRPVVQEPPRPAAEPRERPAPAKKPVVPIAVATPPSASPAQAQSRFGLNRDRALVRLDGPRAWVSDQPTRTVSGTILGGLPERLVVYVNGVPAELSPTGRTFETAALLRPGMNELRAVVTSPGGLESEDTITVQYVPRPSSSGIVLTSPRDGLTLGPDDPPVAVVEGELDDQNLTTVWIVANDRRIPVAASAGKFRHTLLLTDPLVQLRAEASGGDVMRQSGTVTIRTAGARPSSGVLVVQWPAGTDGSSVEVSATWRAQPERLDAAVQSMRLPAVEATTNGAPSAMFYLRGLKPGVYTLIVRQRGTASLGDVRPTLYLPDKDRLAPRTLRPVSLQGAGRRVVAKVLMPEGVLWSQDEWFSGTSESVDTVTKFRAPEGISWVERKTDLQ
jgi:hypothetical protein